MIVEDCSSDVILIWADIWLIEDAQLQRHKAFTLRYADL